MKKIVGVLVAFCVGAFLHPATADTVFNINQTVPNSCVVGVIGVSDNTANATANWSPNTYNCAAGTYLPAGNDWANDSQGCTQCPANSYCTGGTFTYNESSAQGIGSCPSGYASSTGAGAISQCQINCPANTYIASGTYTRLEYITFNFDTYIDTGYKFTSEIAKIKFDFNMTSFAPGAGQMGAQNAPNNTTALIVYDNQLYVGYQGYAGSNVLLTGRHNVELSANSGSITIMQDSQQTFSNTYTGSIKSSNSWPFGAYYTEPSQHSGNGIAGDLYSLQLYDNNLLVRDMVPTRRNSDNVLGMLDLVTGTFFTNAGTGTFVAGPDVGPIGGSCSACAAGYNAAAHTVAYGATDSCNANIINISWKNATGAEQAATTCTYDGAITTPANEPVKRGYTFTGWTLGAQ